MRILADYQFHVIGLVGPMCLAGSVMCRNITYSSENHIEFVLDFLQYFTVFR